MRDCDIESYLDRLDAEENAEFEKFADRFLDRSEPWFSDAETAFRLGFASGAGFANRTRDKPATRTAWAVAFAAGIFVGTAIAILRVI